MFAVARQNHVNMRSVSPLHL